MNKNSKLIFIVAATISLLFPCIAQAEFECEKLLQDGLYRHFRMTNTGSFSQDFRTYLLSETFKKDLQKGRWGGSLTVPIDGIPISIGADANDEEASVFREKILSETELNVDSTWYQSLVISVPDTGLAQIYAQCIEGQRFGFKTSSARGDGWVSYTITYYNEVPSDPMPTVKLFRVHGVPEEAISTSISENNQIKASNTVFCKTESQQEVILQLETDRGTVLHKTPGEREFSGDMPVGTIVSSILTLEQFYAATENNQYSPGGIWTASNSKWCPADGRAVPNSEYTAIASRERVPDLRGVFLRGVNVIEAVPPIPLDASRSDPETRSPGSYQSDNVGPHTHTVTDKHGKDPGEWGPNSGPGNENDSSTRTTSGPTPGAKETRPKNVAVVYYIRIN